MGCPKWLGSASAVAGPPSKGARGVRHTRCPRIGGGGSGRNTATSITPRHGRHAARVNSRPNPYVPDAGERHRTPTMWSTSRLGATPTAPSNLFVPTAIAKRPRPRVTRPDRPVERRNALDIDGVLRSLRGMSPSPAGDLIERGQNGALTARGSDSLAPEIIAIPPEGFDVLVRRTWDHAGEREAGGFLLGRSTSNTIFIDHVIDAGPFSHGTVNSFATDWRPRRRRPGRIDHEQLWANHP
jgi:hypothetical protein